MGVFRLHLRWILTPSLISYSNREVRQEQTIFLEINRESIQRSELGGELNGLLRRYVSDEAGCSVT